MTKRELENLDYLDEALKGLNRDERFMINARYGLHGKRLTGAQIGEYLCVRPQTVSQLVKRALSKLRRQIDRLSGAELIGLPSEKTIRAANDRRDRVLMRFRDQKRHFPWVDQTIQALEAYKRGESLEMRCTWWDSWSDFDLTKELDRDGIIWWRAKPKLNES